MMRELRGYFASVPTVPGTEGATSLEEARVAAAEIGDSVDDGGRGHGARKIAAVLTPR